jgi:hypothetical protein
MQSRAPFSLLAPLAAVALVAAAIACGPADFDPSTKLNSVRILASRINDDKAYAKPGDSVEVEVLAFDGRAQKPRPMQIYWIPFPCVNPSGDLYYACFADPASAAGGTGGGADGGAGAPGVGQALGQLKPGVDLTPFLPTGPKFKVDVPSNIIDAHPPVVGASAPYGLIILFNVVCAGHIEIVPVDPSAGPQGVPLACFDEAHNRLPPSDYVIGFTRVYAYASRANKNPVIDGVTLDGAPIALAAPAGDPGGTYGITHAPCPTDCETKLDVQVPESSYELSEGDIDPDGQTRHEQIWVDYYATDGKLDGDARLLWDPTRGKVTGAEEPYHFPDAPAEGSLFVVVHDNRDGVSWLQIPLHVR